MTDCFAAIYSAAAMSLMGRECQFARSISGRSHDLNEPTSRERRQYAEGGPPAHVLHSAWVTSMWPTVAGQAAAMTDSSR